MKSVARFSDTDALDSENRATERRASLQSFCLHLFECRTEEAANGRESSKSSLQVFRTESELEFPNDSE
jgi:hypothetical protein